MSSRQIRNLKPHCTNAVQLYLMSLVKFEVQNLNKVRPNGPCLISVKCANNTSTTKYKSEKNWKFWAKPNVSQPDTISPIGGKLGGRVNFPSTKVTWPKLKCIGKRRRALST